MANKKSIESNESPIDVVCAIIVKNDMILAAARNESVANAGLWEFPGGRLVEGEPPEECVVRKVQEELGLRVKVVDQIPPFHASFKSGKRFVMHPYFAEIVDGRVSLVWHSKAEWFMPIQLMQLAWTDTDIPIIETIVDRVILTGYILPRGKR